MQIGNLSSTFRLLLGVGMIRPTSQDDDGASSPSAATTGLFQRWAGRRPRTPRDSHAPHTSTATTTPTLSPTTLALFQSPGPLKQTRQSNKKRSENERFLRQELSAQDRNNFDKIMKINLPHFKFNHRHTLNTPSTGFILHAHNRFRYYWDIYIFILLIYVALVSVFVFSFFGSLPIDEPWFWIERFLDVSFTIDIILNFFTSYKHENLDQSTAPTLRATSLRYLTTYFTFDLIATLPWDLFAKQDSDKPSLLQMFRFLRLLRLLKLRRLVTVLPLRPTFTKIEVKLRLKYGYIRLALLAFTVALITHWFACLFYFFGSVPASSELTFFDSWTEDDTKVPKDGYGRYILALYFSIYTITTIGYGDVVPGTTLERTYVNVIMVLGAACFAYVISQVSNIHGEMNETSATYRHMMDSLTDLARVRKLPEKLCVEIRLFFQRYYMHKRVSDEKEVLKVMSNGLRLRVLKHMYGPYISRTGLFTTIPDADLTAVYSSIKERFVPQDDVLFNSTEDATSMFIVKNGNVMLKDCDGNSLTLSGGAVIGATDMPVLRRRDYEAIVTTTTELLEVPRSAIVQVLQRHEHTFHAMRNAQAKRSWEQAIQLLDRHTKFADMSQRLRQRAELRMRQSNSWGDEDEDGNDGEMGTRTQRGLDSENCDGEGEGEGTGSSSIGRADSMTEGEVENMRRELGEKTERVRILEQRMSSLQRQLNSIMESLRSSHA